MDLHQKQQSVSTELPIPDDEAQVHSDNLTAFIRDEIQANDGKITFARFMELALYAPALGYYSAGVRKFGESGDFITAPEISPLFSRCLARQCYEVMNQIEQAEILEVGAGTGAMASDILAELERLDALPERYLILDLSAELRERQYKLLEQRMPHLLNRIEWLDTLPDEGFNGIVLANELLDAMPVHRVHPANKEEDYVVWQDNKFVWQRGPLSDDRLRIRIEIIREHLKDIDDSGQDYTTEINIAAEDWVRSIASVLDKGMVLIIDYGYPRHEYYLLDRNDGTLMCHYRHRAHPDPLILTGLQDITAHVDFTSIAETAFDAGLSVAGFTTQAYFLLGNGITDMLDDQQADEKAQLIQAQQIKKLTLPTGMGELFKVMALARDIDGPFSGFAMQDRRGRL